MITLTLTLLALTILIVFAGCLCAIVIDSTIRTLKERNRK